MEFVIVTRDLLEIYVMTFALKGRLEFLQIVMVTFLFNLKHFKALYELTGSDINLIHCYFSHTLCVLKNLTILHASLEI